MTTPTERAHHRLRRIVSRLVSSATFWGLLGWALLILRYASEVIHPRYGG